MTRSHEILALFKEALDRVKDVKTYSIVTTKHGSTLAFITKDDNQGYVLSLSSVNSVIEVKPLMYSDIIKGD